MESVVPQLDRVASAADQVIVLTNPKAGSGQSAERLAGFLSCLEQNELRTTVVSRLDKLKSVATALLQKKCLRAVVAAGGDGTAELIANLTPMGTPLGVFPLGTENLLSKYLQLSGDPKTAARTIAEGKTVRLDAGLLKRPGHDDRLFLLMLGCGFDAEVVHRLHKHREGNINHLSYAKPIIESIRSYEYPPLHVSCYESCDAQQAALAVTAHWVFVFNTPSYAIGLGICPEALPYDALLDVATFEGGSFWQGLFHLSAVVLGQHRSLQGVTISRAKRIVIQADQDVPFQVDGDPGGYLPIEVHVLPNRLTVVVPQDWAAQHEPPCSNSAVNESSV